MTTQTIRIPTKAGGVYEVTGVVRIIEPYGRFVVHESLPIKRLKRGWEYTCTEPSTGLAVMGGRTVNEAVTAAKEVLDERCGGSAERFGQYKMEVVACQQS